MPYGLHSLSYMYVHKYERNFRIPRDWQKVGGSKWIGFNGYTETVYRVQLCKLYFLAAANRSPTSDPISLLIIRSQQLLPINTYSEAIDLHCHSSMLHWFKQWRVTAVTLQPIDGLVLILLSLWLVSYFCNYVQKCYGLDCGDNIGSLLLDVISTELVPNWSPS